MPPSGCLRRFADTYLDIQYIQKITYIPRASHFLAISATVMDPLAFTVAAWFLFLFMTHDYFGGPTKLGQTFVDSAPISDF